MAEFEINIVLFQDSDVFKQIFYLYKLSYRNDNFNIKNEH